MTPPREWNKWLSSLGYNFISALLSCDGIPRLSSCLAIKRLFTFQETCAWWRHKMESFSAPLALREGNPPVTGGFPSQRPVTRSFDLFFDLRLNKRLSKQMRRRWFESPSRSLWRHCNESIETSIFYVIWLVELFYSKYEFANKMYIPIHVCNKVVFTVCISFCVKQSDHKTTWITSTWGSQLVKLREALCIYMQCFVASKFSWCMRWD